MQRITYSSTISALNRAGQWQKALQQLVGEDRSSCLRVFEILLSGVGPYVFGLQRFRVQDSEF